MERMHKGPKVHQPTPTPHTLAPSLSRPTVKSLSSSFASCPHMRAYLKEFPVARVSFRKPPIVFGQKQERARPPKLHCTEGQEEKGIEDRRMSTVCVTGGAGHIATWLINKLLCRGCVVHATLRNLGDEKKTNLLMRMPGAEERLVLFEADMYDAATFEPAIAGCDFVFLIATPIHHDPRSTKYTSTTEAAVDATRIILQQCERSKTVKRIIHTASVTAASPLREDGGGGGYKDFINDCCWTPLNFSHRYSNALLDAYLSSKTLSEKELLRYNESERPAFEVVTLACALVGGDSIQPYHTLSIPVIVSPLTGRELSHGVLKFMQASLGSVPLVHVDDVCEAHIFCMEQPSIAGRFLCAARYPNMQDYVDRFAAKYPEIEMKLKEVVGEGVRVKVDTNKLVDLGFKYKYEVDETLNHSTPPYLTGLEEEEIEQQQSIEERSSSSRVCVTGASGYIATCLIKKLLQRGCVVHATLRNLGDEKKTAPLKELPGAVERLVLFEADMYDADTFEPAIAGCEFVFLLATPLHHDPRSTKYKNTTEAAVDAMRIILQQCERSKTVRRVIHTASVTAASPLREDGGEGYKDFINESCWTPLDHSHSYNNTMVDDYSSSKTLTEKLLLRYNESESRAFEVVTLACALVGGDADTTQLYHSLSIPVIVSPLTGDESCHNTLKFLQALIGSVPLAHIEDICEAHIFCTEQPSIAGFLCAVLYPNMQDYVDHFVTKYPEITMKLKEVVGKDVRVQADTNKLVDLGFKYKYAVDETLSCSVECAKRLGLL
uniref:NAD-dependent epimerase/dehydratase domain-containing protein n=1 Tax=Oryza glumipatula TaxID=40148 RepID=A0A0E0AMB9_9ORYZ